MRQTRRLLDFQAHLDSHRGYWLQSKKVYCGCGYSVVVCRLLDTEVPISRFYDYSDHEQELSCCPGCGTRLEETALRVSCPGDGI